MRFRWVHAAFLFSAVILSSCSQPADLPVAREKDEPLKAEPEPPTLEEVPLPTDEEIANQEPPTLPEEPMLPIVVNSEPEAPPASPPAVPEPEQVPEPDRQPEALTPEPQPPTGTPPSEEPQPPAEPPPPPTPTPASAEFLNQFAFCNNQQGVVTKIIVKPFSVNEFRNRGLSAAEALVRRTAAIERFNTYPMTQVSYLSVLDHYVFSISVLENQESIARNLFETGDYELVRRDCVFGPALVPDDTEYANQTYLPVIAAPTAWDTTTGSTAVTIAILDSGVDTSQEDLLGKTLPGYNTGTCAPTASAPCGSYDPVVTVDACRHHGTEVAAIAAGAGNDTRGVAGISFGARVLPVRITNAADCTSTTSDMVEGILWASEQGAQVINVSYAGVFDPAIQAAAEQARRNGSLVVFAAGNNGLGSSMGGEDLYDVCLPFFGAVTCAAQTHPDVLVVGATNNADAIAGFSNFGSLVDMVAPGVGIRTSQIGNVYVDVDGTSFSAPIVAGAAALVWSVNPSFSPSDVQHIILDSVLDLGAAGEDDTFGRGRLRLDQMIISAQAQTTATSFIDNAKLDFRIPKSPVKVVSSDQSVRSGSGSRLLVFAQENPGLITFETGDISRRDLTLTELPSGAVVGRGSLFYRRTDITSDFVFTDNSRTRVYLGSMDEFGSNSSGTAVVHESYCGPFTEISDIHLTTDSSGNSLRLLVADKGANRLYSYALDPNSATPCGSAMSVSLTSPLWIRSNTAANPRIYVGYRPGGLSMQAYLNSDLSTVGAAQSITTSTTARFGHPLLDTTNSELWVPIQFAYDSTGDDYVLRYPYGTYPPAVGATPTILTCPSPTQILQDYEGVSRYTYFLCPMAKQVDVYDTTYASVGRIQLTFTPRKMLATSDGTNRYLSFLRSDARLTIYDTPVASPPEYGITNISLPAIMDDLGTFGSLDQTVLVNAEENILTFVDNTTQTLNLTTTLPSAIDHMAPQSSVTNHFVSSDTNSAYTLEELSNGVWKMRQYVVGTYPIQIGYRTNRLYTLNRSSNNLSVVDLGLRTVSNLALGTRPVHFDFSAAQNRLWAVNETSQNLTTVNITPGGPEAVLTTTALGFTPKKVRYQSSDDTLYVAGPTQVRVLDRAALTTVATQTISAGVSDIDLVTGGIWATSRNGVSASRVTRAGITTTNLTGSPHLLTSNASVGVAGLMGIRTLTNSAGNSWQTNAFTSLFSNLTYLYAYNTASYRMQIFPYSQMGTTTFPSASLPVLFDIDRWGTDSVGNIWTASRSQLKLQRVTSQLQLENLTNLTSNRPQDLVFNSTDSRVYILARNLNALFSYDTANDILSAYSVCQAPSKILFDSPNSQLFILCQELNAISVITLDAAGDPSTQAILSTALRPIDMALNSTTNRLYVANKYSDSIYVFNTTSLGTAPTSVTVDPDPNAMVINGTTNAIHVFHESAKTWSAINGGTNAVTETATASFGFFKAAVNTTSAVVYAISASPTGFFYSDSSLDFVVSGTNRLESDSRPSDISVSSVLEKIFITYDTADTLRVLDENAETAVDIATGDNPKRVTLSESLNRIYVSNYDGDSITIINRSTNAIVSTVSLTDGCGPMKSAIVNVGGTDYLYILCELNDTVERMNTGTLGLQTPLSIRVN